MAKKERSVEEQIEFLTAGISTEIDHWRVLRDNGCSDPFHSDGCNMNLTRNHIIYNKRQIEELCQANGLELPEDYYLAIPPEVDRDYMAPNLKHPERLKTLYTDMGKTAVRTCPEYQETESKERGTPIEELDLSVRAYNCIKRFGINTIEVLEERIDEFCAHAANFGKEARRLLDERKKKNTMIEPQMKTPPADVKTAVTDKYTEAYNLNVRICVNAQMAQQNLWEVCKGLKEMRDGKLYKELGYQNFEDYTENEVGFGRRQAYRMIDIAEKLPTDFVTSMSQIGMTKLALLAKLDEPQREEIQQTVNVEEISVRELKAEIDKLNEEKAGFKERQDKLLTRNKQLVSELETVGKKLDKTESDLDEARDTVQNLEKQLQELESKPRDSFEDLTKINELTAKLNEEQERHTEELERLRSEYEKQPEIIKDNKAIFKAYMQATVDSMKHLTAFCEQNSDSTDRTLFIEKLETIIHLTNRTITKLKGES